MNIKNKVLVTKSYISTRNKPINLEQKDDPLFSEEYSKKIDETYYIEYTNLHLHENFLYKNLFFAINPKYFKMDTSNWNLIKIIIKRLRYVIKNLKKDIVLSNGSWVIDDKSFNYFHWMTDVLSRIEMLNKSTIEKYPILLPNKFKNLEFVIQTLDLLELPHYFFDEKTNYKIKNIIVTTHAAPAGNFNQNQIKKISDKLKLKANIGSPKNLSRKIWLSRSHQNRRLIKNENEIVNFLLKHEYEVIYPEELSIIQQIKIFNNAKTIISAHGAALTNLMFANENTKILEIRIFSDSVRNAFFTLASEFNLRYYYFLADANSEDLVEDLYIDLQKFQEVVKLLD